MFLGKIFREKNYRKIPENETGEMISRKEFSVIENNPQRLYARNMTFVVLRYSPTY